MAYTNPYPGPTIPYPAGAKISPYAGVGAGVPGAVGATPYMGPAAYPVVPKGAFPGLGAGVPGANWYPGVAAPIGGPIPWALPGAGVAAETPDVPTTAEESYIENILRFNRGKIGTFYMTFENNEQWNARKFRGRIETAGRDHIIISDPVTGKRYLLLMVNLDYVEFDEPLAYLPPEIPPVVKAELTRLED